MTKDNIDRLRKLMQKFHKKELIITDEQLSIVYDFLYNSKFYPIKEKLLVRQSVIETVLYLKRMATRSGYDTIDKIEQYFKDQRDKIDKMFDDFIRNN